MSRSLLVSALLFGLISSAGVSAQSGDDNGGGRDRGGDDNPSLDDNPRPRAGGGVDGRLARNSLAIRNSGKILGVVECDTGEPAPAGTLVFIAGDSFLSRTDDRGKFRLRFVPPGVYDLTIETPDQAFDVPAEVRKGRVTDLGALEVSCGTGDGTPSEICDDFIDNDADGLIDLDDTDCSGTGLTETICDDFIDDDGDGLIDLDDPDCSGGGTVTIETICDDFIDDDLDGLIDLDDPDCSGSGTGLTETICNDLADDDGDGLVDLDDPDCSTSGTTETICDDFSDDDGDGLIDLDDSDCLL